MPDKFQASHFYLFLFFAGYSVYKLGNADKFVIFRNKTGDYYLKSLYGGSFSRIEIVEKYYISVMKIGKHGVYHLVDGRA